LQDILFSFLFKKEKDVIFSLEKQIFTYKKVKKV